MFNWSNYLWVALHHGLVVAVGTLLGCVVVRYAQLRLGKWLGHEVALPKIANVRWGALGGLVGCAGAYAHWSFYRDVHGYGDVGITWLMATFCTLITWTSLDRRFARDRLGLLILTVVLFIEALLFALAWRHPNLVNWWANFEAQYTLGAAMLIAFPVPPRPKRAKQPRPKPRPKTKPKPWDPDEQPFEPGSMTLDPGERRFEPED